MAVTVIVPDHSTRYGVDFDKSIFDLFPSVLTREYFRKVLRQYEIGFTTASMLARRLSELVHEPSQIRLFDLCRPLVRLEDQLEYNLKTPSYNMTRTDRRVVDRRFLTESFGFQICGGREQNCGVFVSSVDRHSPAWKADIRPGFQITRVNGMSTAKATHRMFVDYIKISVHLELLIKNVGMVPRPTKTKGTRWHFPPSNETNSRDFGPSAASGSLPASFREPLLFIKSLQGTVLGTHVRPSPYGLVVTSVKPGSAAAVAKILPGDLIIEVNDTRLDGLDFEDCVAHLRCETPFSLRIRRQI
jgi:predicted metalloprotease with PDZ domain